MPADDSFGGGKGGGEVRAREGQGQDATASEGAVIAAGAASYHETTHPAPSARDGWARKVALRNSAGESPTLTSPHLPLT